MPDIPDLSEMDTSMLDGSKTQSRRAAAKRSAPRPDTTVRTKAPSATAEAALDILKAAEDMLTVPLMMFSPKAAIQWSDALPKLRERNLRILQNNPDLCKRIVSANAKTGPSAIIISYAMVAIPVAGIAVADIRSRRGNAETAAPTETPRTDNIDATFREFFGGEPAFTESNGPDPIDVALKGK
jgi:hypothetical protein